MKGFKNIGNTCYLNSGLQMIVQNDDLYKLIKKYDSHSDILKKITNFIELYNNSSSDKIIIPKDIKKIVENKKELFMGYGQQDSTEFLIYLLDTIDEEIKKINADSDGIKQLFGIDFNVRIKCKLRDCLQIYNKKETNNFLLLDIEDTFNNLEDAYRNFKSSDKLEDDNKYYCEKCKTKRIASKRQLIEKWPPHLFIWLKRYKQNGKLIKKNDQKIEIPLEWRHENELQGAIIHYGDLNGGHYVYIGKNNNKWYLFNDSSISEINDDVELIKLLGNAYWLYYKQKN